MKKKFTALISGLTLIATYLLSSPIPASAQNDELEIVDSIVEINTENPGAVADISRFTEEEVVPLDSIFSVEILGSTNNSDFELLAYSRDDGGLAWIFRPT